MITRLKGLGGASRATHASLCDTTGREGGSAAMQRGGTRQGRRSAPRDPLGEGRIAYELGDGGMCHSLRNPARNKLVIVARWQAVNAEVPEQRFAVQLGRKQAVAQCEDGRADHAAASSLYDAIKRRTLSSVSGHTRRLLRIWCTNGLSFNASSPNLEGDML